MKKLRLVLFSMCFLLILHVDSLSQKAPPRVRQNFDFDWKFQLNDSIDASTWYYNDSGWENIQLPHDWSISLPLVEPASGRRNLGSMGFMQGGTGWYRKNFYISSDYRNKLVSVQFDGVYHQCDVYINGRHLGFHPYGYTGFEYDLTGYLNIDGDNTLAVKVDHSNYPSSRWYSGSGIYRHVWLTVTDKIHVPSWGTCITTPEVTDEAAVVRIVTTVENGSGKIETVQVRNRILDSDGNEVISSTASKTVAEGSREDFEQTLNLEKPVLWSVEDPHLYRMETTIRSGGSLKDIYVTPFGVRWFRFDADKGFFLNGKNIKLKGVNLHQDAGSLGTAVPDMSYLRRLRILKEYGCNAIRCSHNPPSPEFLDICDSLGFVVIDEAFDKWKSGYYAQYFDLWWQRDLGAMLLRDRNHPSVMVWSIGNETNEQNTGNGARVARMLQDYVHRVDPTRPVTAAIAPANIIARPYNENGFTEVLDMVGYNYQEPWLERDKKRFPGRIMYIAEAFPYYTGRHNSIRDYRPDNPWYAVQENDYVFGQFIWAGVDYLGESSGWPSTGWPTGLFDVCMFEKPRAAFHRSVWNPEPMVRIAVADQSLDIDPGKDHWSWPHLAEHWNFPQYKGHIIEVQTISNCDSVELWVNKATMGRRAVADYPNNTIVWHVPYREGKIEARGYVDGREAASYELNTSGRASGLVLVPDRKEISADGQDLVHIAIHLVDDKGVIVPDDDRQLVVEVSGTGRLLGIDNGDLRKEGSYAVNSIRTYFGKAMAVVQSTRNQGEIKVEVKTDGLPVSSMTIASR